LIHDLSSTFCFLHETQDKTSAKAATRGFIDAHFDEQVGVLAPARAMPSDNPNRPMPSSRLGKAPTVGK